MGWLSCQRPVWRLWMNRAGSGLQYSSFDVGGDGCKQFIESGPEELEVDSD